jgi:hypothetical protein
MRKSKNMKDLEKCLSDIAKPVLSVAKREKMKLHLMQQIRMEEMLSLGEEETAALFDRGVKISLTADKRALIKERVFELIDLDVQKSLFWSRFWAFNRRLASGFLVLVMAFGYVSILNINTSVVHAAKLTVLADFNDVVVERDGAPLVVFRGMEIEENDRISTGKEGSAVINYFDDSVSRLASDTSVKVNKLEKNDEGKVEGHVEIEVEEGEVWSKVLNVVDSDSTFVVEAAEVKTSASRGAFNVDVEEEDVEIEVFNYAVEVETERGTDKVISGEKVILDVEDQIVKEKRKLVFAEKDNDWVKQNIEQDKHHLKLVETEALAASKEALGGDLEIREESVKEKALLLLTFDDVKTAQIDLDLAEKNFIAAEIKLYQEELTEEEVLAIDLAFADFARQIEDFHYLIIGVEEKDTDYAAKLRAYLDGKINLHKEFMAALGPQSPAYDAKQVVEEAEVFTADEGDVLEIKKSQAEEKLILAEEAASSGDAKAASMALIEYEQDVSDAVELDEDIEKDLEFADAVKDAVEDAEVEAIEKLIDGAFGVEIQGDKPLDPLLQGF